MTSANSSGVAAMVGVGIAEGNRQLALKFLVPATF